MFTGRRILLALALICTLVAVWFAPQDPDNVVQPSDNKARNHANDGKQQNTNDDKAANSNKAKNIDVLVIHPRLADKKSDQLGSLFASANWINPEPVKPVIPKLVKNTVVQEIIAPALPFKFLGRYQENGQIAVFLNYAEQNLVAHVGDTLLGTYKVETINNNEIILRHLPSNKTQSMALGSM